MHEEQIKRSDAVSDELIRSLEKVEQEIGELGGDLDREKQLRHLARLISDSCRRTFTSDKS